MAGNSDEQERLLRLELEKLKAQQAQKQSEMEQYGRELSSIEKQSGIIRPEYESPLIKGEDGQYQLPEHMKVQAPEALLEMERRAMSEGPTAWAQKMMEQQDFEQQGLQDQAARQALAGTLQAQQSLAMRGGLGGGAAERLAGQGSQGLLQARQQAARMGMAGKLNIGLQDQTMKDQMLQSLPGTQIGMQQSNIGMLADTLKQQELAKQADYATQMQAWSAGEQAKATKKASGGGGGCFITTACCEVLGLPDDNAILNTFREFRDNHLGGKEGVSSYYEVAPQILANMHDKADLYSVISNYLIPCHKLIKSHDYDSAYQLYKNMVNHLEAKYIIKENVYVG